MLVAFANIGVELVQLVTVVDNDIGGEKEDVLDVHRGEGIAFHMALMPLLSGFSQIHTLTGLLAKHSFLHVDHCDGPPARAKLSASDALLHDSQGGPFSRSLP